MQRRSITVNVNTQQMFSLSRQINL